MINYTSMRAYATLYSSYNDIDIYVEDSTLVGSYERIFKQLFEGKYRVETVIPFGKKNDIVLEAQRLSNDNGRKRFFLVDGDFDWIFRPLVVKNLYEIKAYSIENFLLDEDALLAFAGECESSFTNSALISNLDFVSLVENIEALTPLMAVYATARALGSSEKTVTYSVDRLINPRTKMIDRTLVRDRVFASYRNLISEFDAITVQDFYNEIKFLIKVLGKPGHRIIAGKHYLVNILLKHFQRKFSFAGRRGHFVAGILERSKLETDPDFLIAIDLI